MRRQQSRADPVVGGRGKLALGRESEIAAHPICHVVVRVRKRCPHQLTSPLPVAALGRADTALRLGNSVALTNPVEVGERVSQS